METIELQQTLPEVFAGRDRVISDVWHREIAFQKGKIYLLEAASGTGKSSLCSFIYGYRKDYQGIISFDGQNIRNLLFLLMGRISAICPYPNGCICGKLH